MSIKWSPLSRLNNIKVAVVVTPDKDPMSWKLRCESAASSGVSMVIVNNCSLYKVDELLVAARNVFDNGLVGVAEPVDAGVRADVIHLETWSNAANWDDRLRGCQVSSLDEAQAGLEVGCAYLVVDCQIDGLVSAMVDFAQTQSNLIWFVSGCADVQALTNATSQGARRVWVDGFDPALAQLSSHLRQVWRQDPNMSSLAVLRRSFNL